MPYTPPGQQSPASSQTNSPTISRSASYSEHDGPLSPAVGRPAPPRSMLSASYLHRQRRSPSIIKADGAPPTPVETTASNVHAVDFAHSSSVRQSPPPVNNLMIPTGAVLSPPDSSENSDGDEPASKNRGRQLETNWDELELAVRALDQSNRDGSPNRGGILLDPPASEPVSQSTSPTALSAAARKISHSQSSSETAIIIPRPQFQSSDDSDEDDLLSKPSLVRKKSGELVKPALRPSSRRRYSSMPGTPTYSKSVHFNDNDNQTRHFLQVDKPIAVSAGSSPVETHDSESEFPFDATGKLAREIKLANFPPDSFARRAGPVRVDRIFLSQDKQTLVGVVAVQNIAFHKLVVARFTLDYWKTTSEVVAEYNNDPRNPTTDGCDRFNFHVKLSDQANIDSKTLLLCVRYNVGGQDYWDNNNGMNYQIDFAKTAAKKAGQSSKSLSMSSLGQRPLHSIPRSRHSSPASSSGKPGSVDDDFATRFDIGSSYHFGSSEPFLHGESAGSIKLKPRSKRGSLFHNDDNSSGVTNATTMGLGGRYDFHRAFASPTTAQDSQGRQSGPVSDPPSFKSANSGANVNSTGSERDSYFPLADRTNGPTPPTQDERPDALLTGGVPFHSEEYKDLLQRYCYVGSASPAASNKLPTPSTIAVGDA